jgi:hypothetical protein
MVEEKALDQAKKPNGKAIHTGGEDDLAVGGKVCLEIAKDNGRFLKLANL